MKKKIIFTLCTLALVLGLVGCGKASDDDLVGGFPRSTYESTLKNTLTSIESLDEATLEQYLSQAEEQEDTVTAGFISDYLDCYPVKGEFIDWYDNDKVFGGFNIGKLNIGGTKAFDVAKSGKTITASVIGQYSGRDLKLTFVYNALKVQNGPTAVNIEPVYSLGETMGKAGLNTIMGILIVFAMLVLMSGVIKLFEIIPKLQKKAKAKDEADAVPVAAKPVVTAKNETDDLQLVAVIAAAIAAATGASTDSFVVRSIKKRR